MPWVWIPRRISSDYHDQVLACCHAVGIVPNQRHLTRSVATQLAMVGAGAGVAIAPASAVPDGPTAKAVRQQHLPAKVTASTELSAIHRDEPDLLIERFLALNQACARATYNNEL